jgi:ribonuclease P protein component
MVNHAEKNIPTEQSSPGQDARLQSPHGYEKRPPRPEKAAGKGPEEIDALTLLDTSLGIAKCEHLQNPAQFRLVYEKGLRYDGLFMSVFVLRNSLDFHRFGLTASRKLSKSAVKRNRAKRLLREVFRLSRGELKESRYRYDWVLNARRPILKVKISEPFENFREIIRSVIRVER